MILCGLISFYNVYIDEDMAVSRYPRSGPVLVMVLVFFVIWKNFLYIFSFLVYKIFDVFMEEIIEILLVFWCVWLFKCFFYFFEKESLLWDVLHIAMAFGTHILFTYIRSYRIDCAPCSVLINLQKFTWR